LNLPKIYNPFPIFLNQVGGGLNGGKVYIGLPGMDPQTYPKAVFWDAEATIPAAQPLSTMGGMIWRSGSPARAYTDGSYSLRVTDKFGAQVFYEPSVVAASQADLINDPIVGLTLSNNITLPNVAIDVSPGSCKDKTGYVPLSLATILTKRLNAVWAAGNGAGGLDTGALTVSTVYNFFLIYNPTTLTVDGLFSTSFSAPALPGGYTASRYIGSVKTDAAGAILPFLNVGDRFWFRHGVIDANIVANSTAATLRTLSVPRSGIKVSATIRATCGGSGSAFLFFRDPDLGGFSTADALDARGVRYSGAPYYFDTFEVETNGNACIYTASSVSAGDETVTIVTQGWAVDRSVYR
jgi:hypothetical protein